MKIEKHFETFAKTNYDNNNNSSKNLNKLNK